MTAFPCARVGCAAEAALSMREAGQWINVCRTHFHESFPKFVAALHKLGSAVIVNASEDTVMYGEEVFGEVVDRKVSYRAYRQYGIRHETHHVKVRDVNGYPWSGRATVARLGHLALHPRM